MSTLEKTINLLHEMQEYQIETVYAFTQFINTPAGKASFKPKKPAESILGIAHKYANPELIEQEEGAFERAMSEKHALD